MANKKSSDVLIKAGGELELARQLKLVKASGDGKILRLHEVIRKVYPNYKIYRLHATIIKELQKVIDGKNNRLIIQLPPRHGKQAAHSTPVLTSNGWTTHGQLRVGDKVFHPFGHQIEVLALSPETQSNARVHLSNGETIECHLNHEWTVYDRGRQKWRTVETNELIEWSHQNTDRCRYQLPDIEAVQFDSKDLIMDPYILGVWLGDGRSDSNVFCGAESDNAIAEAVETRGYQITSKSQHKTTGVWYYILDGLRTGGNGRFSRELKALNLRKNKHIPESYLRSSIPQRLQLLAGLMDTDGNMCPKTGRARIVTASEVLARDIIDLCTTLGFRPYLTTQKPCMSSSGIQGKSMVYTVNFQPNLEIPCVLERKLVKRYAPRRRVGITFAEVTLNGEMGRCIQVSSPDGLYLIGNKLNPTHNSLLSSQLFPAAYLLAHPDRHVGITSYSAELAQGFNRNAREMFRAAGGQLDQYAQAVTMWKTEQGGSCWATGTGGTVTGRSGHLLILDDTTKDRAEAESPLVSQRLWDWYTSALYTRLEPENGAIVMLQTRWAENDLIGRSLEREMNVSVEAREGWTIIDLPAMYEDPGDRPPLPEHCTVIPDWRTEIGEALCPQRYDTSALIRIREAVGSRDFASLYQQRPAPEGGNLFDPTWWQYYSIDDDLPDFERLLLSVDCTFTDNKKSDYVVGAVIGQARNSYYVLEIVREKLDVVGTMNMISRLYNRYKPSGCLIELAASGFAVFQMLKKKVPGLIGYNPHGKSKVARASGIIPTVEAGNVYLPESALWLESFINEFSLFPASKNDDMVDAVSMAINYCSQKMVPQLTIAEWGRQSRPILSPQEQYLIE